MNPHVLVAFDDSDPSRRALEHALEQHPDADITVLTVVGEVGAMGSVADPEARTIADGEGGECDPDVDGFEEIVQERLEEARRMAAEYDVEIETACEVGPPSQEIPAYAAEVGADRIVVGHHGRTGVARLVVGSVSEAVARETDVPVTTVR